eukprot:TRINITY_DN48286_c0_g1_i1.p1 TRINITY_DN48286_c0_g1~~TRINITY_DN48286_c0_g1_i1.p1  ORF type:complete len:673 (-),score=190.16 TRINITY_DN48286_c0_g1_i1:37-2055(-)
MSSGSKVNSAALEGFFQFLQCQLRMEAEEGLQQEVQLSDPKASAMWQQFRAWVQPNLGKKEKWMPFHTVLGAHELFMVENIHHGDRQLWDEKRKFLAMFVFRAHCRSAVFREAQLPHMDKEEFWRNPVAQFGTKGRVTMSMLDYRRRTRQPLQTSAFLAIPERICDDDDENLARNVAMRTQTLLQVAEGVWPIIQDSAKSPQEKFAEISKQIQSGRRLGETWSKMIMVSIDIAYPKLRLLAENCDVGTGAVKGLSRLLPSSSLESQSETRAALGLATAAANSCESHGAGHFWKLLEKVEVLARKRYGHLPLVKEQLSTPLKQLSAVTVQVQLCEWRQHLDFLEKTGCPAIAELDSDTGARQRNKMRRVVGKRRMEEAIEPEDSEDDKPLVRNTAPRLTAPPAPPAPGASSPEALQAAHLEAARNALKSLAAEAASAEDAKKAAEQELLRCESACHAASQCFCEACDVVEAAESELRKAELLLTKAARGLVPAARHKKFREMEMDAYDAVMEKIGGALEAGESEASFAGVEGGAAIAMLHQASTPFAVQLYGELSPLKSPDEALAERARKALQKRFEYVSQMLQAGAQEERSATEEFEKEEDKQAELMQRSKDALARRTTALNAREKAQQSLCEADKRCVEAEQEVVKRRTACHLAEAEARALRELLAVGADE